ncbi:MAG: ATP-binding protein [Acidimicrobiales bacterium]|nr:ATP-binding protein [Acidimicrobiales bacterium]
MTATITIVAVAVALAIAYGIHLVSVRQATRRIDRVADSLDPTTIRRRTDDLGATVDRLERSARVAGAERSDREQAEQRLSRSLDAIPQGVVVADGSGEVVFRNQPGSLYSEARHSDALVEAAIGNLLQRAIGGETAVETVELHSPPRRVLVITAVPLDPDTVGPGAIAVIDDVTERRRLEAVRRDFVANISHELKTPVGALALLAETLVGEEDPAVTSRLSERIFNEAHRVGRTIEDLLELSRIEAEEHPHREAVPVAQVLQSAAARMRPAADQQGITITVADTSAHLTVVGDERQLVSAVFNLLENAVKYSEAGSKVQLRATSDGLSVDISVQDHGMGIPSRDLERVFERFYRIDRARSRQTGGTGLGLAIVRHVVNNHHGEVLVESVEGEGSTFTLRLPTGDGPVPVTTSEAG